MYSKSPISGATATMTTTSIVINNPRSLAIDIPATSSAPNFSSSNDSLLLTTPIIIHGISSAQGILEPSSRVYPSSSNGTPASSTSSAGEGDTNASNSSSSLARTSGLTTPATMTPTMNVKFAPLPQVGPRKRKSSVPLGMAARGQLVRRRRSLQDYDDGTQPIEALDTSGGGKLIMKSTNPMWTDEEIRRCNLPKDKYKKYKEEREMDRMQRKRRVKVHYRERDLEGSDQEFEDPFIQFGKIVKGAIQSSWRRVSQTKEGGDKDKQKEKEKEKGREKESEKDDENEEDGLSPQEKKAKKKQKAKERNRERKKSVDTWREKNGSGKQAGEKQAEDERGRTLSRHALGVDQSIDVSQSPSPGPGPTSADLAEEGQGDKDALSLEDQNKEHRANGESDIWTKHREQEHEPRRSESEDSSVGSESTEGEGKVTVNGSVENLLSLSLEYAEEPESPAPMAVGDERADSGVNAQSSSDGENVRASTDKS
ncbi:hypothetical protein AX16_006676 [Volvariella volvacea WC 439]|nr:hypothetical protein AX16_006676 [Volvariella volvacea WC 439]